MYAWLAGLKEEKKEVFVSVIKINKLIDVDSFILVDDDGNVKGWTFNQ